LKGHAFKACRKGRVLSWAGAADNVNGSCGELRANDPVRLEAAPFQSQGQRQRLNALPHRTEYENEYSGTRALKGHAFKACRKVQQNDPALAAEGLPGSTMKPQREHATNNAQTYMITTSTWERRALFRNERWARLLIDTLYKYRASAYLLHEFVVMPDHIHVLLTPNTSLEKAVQFIKGAFSYRAKKELGSGMEIWQKGFSDHRIRDASDYALHISYIHQNPVKEHFCAKTDDYPHSSAHAGFELDSIPQGLKPHSLGGPLAARLEGVPFQSPITEISPKLKTNNSSETSHEGQNRKNAASN
jgi:putative transposase